MATEDKNITLKRYINIFTYNRKSYKNVKKFLV